MLTIGITGSFGSGKSTVASMFKDLGARVLDADQVARRLMQPSGKCFRPILDEFGPSILRRGKIDRQKLAAVVFNDVGKLRRLEKIIHPQVRREFQAELARHRNTRAGKVVVLDVPLLFEAGFDRLVEVTLVVRAGRETQVARVVRKRKMTRREALARIRLQWPLSRKVKLADEVINNDGGLRATKKQVRAKWFKLLKHI